MKRICVYCGSNLGKKPAYLEMAKKLGITLAERGMTLVYGGASVGIMGELADSVLCNGGKVIGVIPQVLVEKEVSHRGLSELKIVSSMHERKALMAELSCAFIALPGGLGTLEELFEVLTWGQLGFHEKPCGILNVSGYYDGLIEFIDHAVEQQYIKGVYRKMLLVRETPHELLESFFDYRHPKIEKWIAKGEI